MQNPNLDKKYNHLFCEKNSRLFAFQKKLNAINLKSEKNIFTILLPPPNVTGKLHLGHAWNGTIQDCLIRFHTLYDNQKAYWICGSDHAGIASQTKYEKYLRDNKIDNSLKSRKQKIADLYEWCLQNKNTILDQWQQMGFFLDYDNQHFTLDQDSSKLVYQVFVKMYKENLIYKQKTLVNWDTVLQTAISNIEVIKKETETNLYYVRYYLENSNEYLLVATTRIETIFVDECLVVNPDDSRYSKYINKNVVNPLTNKIIPIIADSYVDTQFGTGVMKCTPAHDFNDYEIAQKHNLKVVSCFNENGTTNSNAISFENLKILECRQKCAAFLKEKNLLEKVEKTISSIGYSERTNCVVEPMLSEQWFVKMKALTNKIIENQKTNNKVVFYPLKFEKVLINWISNINDWCISRQLWWGHQIPVWYHKKTKEVYVNTTPPQNIEDYVQDESVLDTWFSSGLWPISTTKSLNNDSPFFPSSVLVTGFDIIFFWVFRMMFFSLYLKNQIPFKNCYITGLTRDSLNRKMSKSLGNGIDPIDLIQKYGADALRLYLLSSSSPGEDLIYNEERIKGSWNFINKLWNSFRFIEIETKEFKYDESQIPSSFNLFDKWIINKFFEMYASFLKLFNNYNFLVAIKKLVDFVWNDFCNTYLEFTKKRSVNQETKFWILNYLLKKILILLHPICPFVTAKLYECAKFKKFDSILYESCKFDKLACESELKIDFVLDIVNKIRVYRFENKIKENKVFKIKLEFNQGSNFALNPELIEILSMAKIEVDNTNTIKNSEPDFVESNFKIFILNKEDLIEKQNDQDLKLKIANEIEFVKKEIDRCNSMLNNSNFLKKAPKDKVELEKQKQKNYLQRLAELEKLLT